MACEDRRADLVGYLYGELDGRERGAMRDHIDACDDCASEFAELAAATSTIRRVAEAEAPWTVARAAGASERAPSSAGLAARPRGLADTIRSWWGGAFAMPRWAFAGALAGGMALVVLVSEIEVTRSGSAFTVSWEDAEHGGAANGATSLAASRGAGGEPGPAAGDPGAGMQVSPAVRSSEGQALLAEVQRILEASEKRQTASTAQLVDTLGTQYARQYEASRRQDLQLVDYWIGSLSGKTQLEFTRTNEQLQAMADLILAGQGGGAVWPGSRGVPGLREGRLEPGSPAAAPAAPAESVEANGGGAARRQ